MVRRTVLTIGIVCGASAAALAFEMSRARIRLVEHAVLPEQRLTAVPASPMRMHGDGRIGNSPNDTPRAEYCRFPRSGGSETPAAAPADPSLGNSIGSKTLILQSQSRVPDALPPELCTADTVGTPRVP